MTTKLRNSERQKSQGRFSWIVMLTGSSSKINASYLSGQPWCLRICRGSPRKRTVSYYLSCHAHHVDSKLTTSQETDSKPKMWRCPPPPIALVSPPTTHLCCSLYTNPYYSDRTHDEEKGSTSHRHSASTKENPSR